MKKNHLFIIISLWLFYVINNYFWLLQNKLSVSYDEGIHLWTNLRFVNAFISPVHNRLYELLHANITHWPPLFYFTAFLFNMVFGVTYVVSVMTNMLFFALLIVSLYLIGKKIHSPSAGILAVIIASFYPIIYGHSRLFLLDFALTSVVTFSVYCLIKADRFKNLTWSVIFGISAGLGMLTKWSYLFFILPLFMYVAIESLRDTEKEKQLSLRKVQNFLITIAVSFLISSTWYVLNIERVGFALYRFKRCIGTPACQPLEGIQWLMLTFNNNMLSFLFFLLFIIGTVIFYTRKNLKFKTFLTVWYLVPLLVISFVKGKQARFFMPVLPCFALISAIALSGIKNRKFKDVLLGFIFAIGLMQYFNISFNDKIGERINMQSRSLKDFSIFYKPEQEGTYSIIGARAPYKEDWKHEELAKSFASYIQELKSYPFVLGIIYNEDKNDVDISNLFANRIMNYYLMKEFIKSDAVFSREISLTLNQLFEMERFVEIIADMQGVIYISKNNTWPTLNDKDSFSSKESKLAPIETNKVMNDYRLIRLINSRKNFNFINRIKLPHDYYANIYLYDIPEIKKDDLAIKIFNGKIKIFYKKEELTKAMGIASFFTKNNKPYFYADAIWDYSAISPYQARATLEWPSLGVKQVILVSLSLNRKNTINISVTLESQKDIKLDCWYMDSVVSNRYGKWVTSFSQGNFKEISMFPELRKYEQANVQRAVPKITGIKTHTDNSLPAMLFICSDNVDTPVSSGLYNTHYYNNGRFVRMGANSEIELKQGNPKRCLDMDITLMLNSELDDMVRKERSAYEK